MYIYRGSKQLGFSAGQADSASPFSLGENENVSLRNLVSLGKKVITRPGIEIVNPGGIGTLDAASYKLRSLIMHVDPLSRVRTLIAGCYAGFAKLNATTGIFEYIPVLSGLILGSYRPWSRCQTLGASYWCRDDSGGILRADPATVGRAGILQPSSAPTLANGGGGVMDAGDYQVVVRFKNSKTGAVSNYSDPSAVLTQAASRKLSVTGIATSTDWQVDTREVGVTIANRPGTYYLGATISDNLTTTCTIDLTVAQMGSEAWNRRNDPPPGNAKFVAWWDAAQALVTTDGQSLYVSETGLPESFSDNIYDFGADDGFDISGLLPVGQRVLVGKPNRVDMLSGLTREEFRKDMLTDNYGVAAGLSMKSVGSTAFWLAQAKDGLCVVRADGSSVAAVSDEKIDAILADVPSDFLPYAEAWIYPLYNLYCLSLSRGQYTDESRYVPEIVVAYNYKDGTWTTWTFDPRFLSQPDTSSFPVQVLAPLSYCDWIDPETGKVVGYLVFDYSRGTSGMDVVPRKPWEYVYSLTATGADTGSDIAWYVITRAMTPERGLTHKPHALHLRATLTGSDESLHPVDVRAYRDCGADDAAIVYTDSWTFNLPHAIPGSTVEHRLPMASRSTLKLGTSYQLKLSGSGYVELHDGSRVEFDESNIRRTVLSVAARTPEDIVSG